MYLFRWKKGLGIEESDLLSNDSLEALQRMEGVGGAEVRAKGTVEALQFVGSTQETGVVAMDELIESDSVTEVTAQGGNGVGLAISEAADARSDSNSSERSQISRKCLSIRLRMRLRCGRVNPLGS